MLRSHVYDLIPMFGVGGEKAAKAVTTVKDCAPHLYVLKLDIFDDGPQHFNICKRDTTGYF